MENLWPGFIGFLSVDGKPVDGQKSDLPSLQAQSQSLIASGVDHRRIHVNDRWSATVGEVDRDGAFVPYDFSETE